MLKALRGGEYCHAYGVNDAGNVVGDSQETKYGAFKPALWSHDHYDEPKRLQDAAGTAWSINNRGIMAGRVMIEGRWRAMLWNTEPIQLTGESADCPAQANAVSDSGVAVGSSLIKADGGFGIGADFGSHAALTWMNGRVTRLPDCGNGEAKAVNGRGVVVGYYVDESRTYRACVWDHGNRTDIETPSKSWTYAYGINDAGDVVGTVNHHNGPMLACLWRNGQLIEVSKLTDNKCKAGVAYAINNRGQILCMGGYLLTPIMQR